MQPDKVNVPYLSKHVNLFFNKFRCFSVLFAKKAPTSRRIPYIYDINVIAIKKMTSAARITACFIFDFAGSPLRKV